jgi:hypothetical protein
MLGDMVRILAALLLVACSSSKDKSEPAPADPATPPPVPKDDSPRGLCTRGCTKLISCAPFEKREELPKCIDTCAAGAPQKAQIEQIESMTCEQIATRGVPPAPGSGGGSAN